MPKRMRVHELAKELGVPSREILAELADLGQHVKSASSTIQAPVAQRLREKFKQSVCVEEQPSPPDEEPEYVFVAERKYPYAHHWDYLHDRNDEALCGWGYENPTTLADGTRPKRVCAACEAKLPVYQAQWWRERFHTVDAELAALRIRFQRLEEHAKNQKQQLSKLQKNAQEARDKRHHNSTKIPRKRNPPGGLPNTKRRKPPPPKREVFDPTKPHPASTARIGVVRPAKKNPVDQRVVRKRVKELMAESPARSEADRYSDEAAADRMRSQKPSSWRLGRSPSSYR